MADIDPAKPLKDFKPKYKFFVGIDSDGCAFDKFINGEYAGDYESKLIAEFDACLPETPAWER